MSEHTTITEQAYNDLEHALTAIDLQILAILQDNTLWKTKVAQQIDSWEKL